MNKDSSTEVFESMPVKQAVLKNALPAMAAMLMVLIYNLADTFFIGQTHDALQVAAVSLATPVFLLFMALGTLFGMGGTSVISRALGEGRDEYAKKVCSFCMWGCVLVGIVMSALMLIFLDETLHLIGASPDTWDYTRTYLVIVVSSGPFVLISNCYSNIIRTEGQSVKAMTGQLLGNLLNVILDPILILVLGWNVAGAAVATVIGNVFAACCYIFYFLRGNSTLSISIRDFTLRNKVMTGVLSIGIPASLGSVLMSVSQIIVNSRMSDYGDMAVAAMGVAMKIVIITGMLCMGLGQGVQPLFGYCFGAELRQRFKESLRFSLIFALCLGVAMTLLCFIFTRQLVGVFLTDETAFGFSVSFSRILLSTGPLFGVFYVLINAIQAMGAATESLIINLSRQGLIFIPSLFVLEAFIGMNGIVWAQPVADVLSLLLAVILYLRIWRRKI